MLLCVKGFVRRLFLCLGICGALMVLVSLSFLSSACVTLPPALDVRGQMGWLIHTQSNHISFETLTWVKLDVETRPSVRWPLLSVRPSRLCALSNFSCELFVGVFDSLNKAGDTEM